MLRCFQEYNLPKPEAPPRATNCQRRNKKATIAKPEFWPKSVLSENTLVSPMNFPETLPYKKMGKPHFLRQLIEKSIYNCSLPMQNNIEVMSSKPGYTLAQLLLT
jgi:hypothetical protein